MIQFNLLPDVKVEYIKTKRLKRILLLSAIAASGVSVFILFLTFSYAAVQKRHLSNLDKDVDRISTELKSNPELTKILSVQNQLNTLPSLYDGRPAVDRLPGYLDQTTPQGVGIGRLTLDLSLSTIEITGEADNLQLVNSYVDTLKYTIFKSDEEGAVEAAAFTNVVLTQFGRDSETADFVINVTFDPLIFDVSKKISLTVPQLVTTRSQGTAAELFDGSGPVETDETTEEGAENGGQ